MKDEKFLQAAADKLCKGNIKPKTIMTFYNYIIGLIDRNEIKLECGCYHIAGTMSIDLVWDDERLSEIAKLAAELELAPENKTAEPKIQEKYLLLKQLIGNHGKRKSSMRAW